MRSFIPCLNSFTLVIIASFLLIACDSSAPKREKKVLVRPAKLLTIEWQNSEDFLNYPAVVKSQQLRSLSFEVGGVVKVLPVIEAQLVKQGAVLAQLDQRDLLAKLDAAQAQFDNAEAEYQRSVRLMKEDAISRSQLEQRRSQRDVNFSQLETTRKALQDTVLTAPFDGAIAKVSIKKLQVVKPGEAAIDILGKGGFEAKINLPSSILAKTKVNGRTAMDPYVVLDVAPNLPIPAVYKEATLEADAASQTYQITFVFDTPDNLVVLPGMNASVWFKDPRKSPDDETNLTVPLSAIAIDGDQKYVWLVDKTSMQVSRQNILVEDAIGVNLTVISGLTQGDVIVSAGVSAVSSGMKVRPWTTTQ